MEPRPKPTTADDGVVAGYSSPTRHFFTLFRRLKALLWGLRAKKFDKRPILPTIPLFLFFKMRLKSAIILVALAIVAGAVPALRLTTSIVESATPPPDSFGWNNTNVSIGFACGDTISGIAFCPAPQVLTTEGLNQPVAGTAFDLAGNSATASLQVSIDKTPPAITAASSPAPNANGWNNTPVTVAFSCADALSGIASCASNQTVSSEGANQVISGTAFDKAGNSAAASVSLNIDETPPTIAVSSPNSGITVTNANLQITGTAADNLSGVALVSCNGTSAVLASGSFNCNVSLLAGANTIQVQASDQAGNTATSQITVTFSATPPVPPKTIAITPNLVNMLVGDSRSVTLIGEIGQAVAGATWSISDPTVVSITSDDPPQLTALAQGTATLTANFNNLSATMIVNVAPGPSFAAGTPVWSIDPLPGNFASKIFRANPFNSGDPDIYVIEGRNTLRAFAADGEQLWTTQVAGPSQNASTALGSLVAAAGGEPALAAKSNGLQAKSVAAVQRIDPFRDLKEQRMRLKQERQKSASIGIGQAALATTTSSSSTFLGRSVPDNSGGTINWITTIPSSPGSDPQDSLVKLDSQGTEIWRFDSPGFLNSQFVVGPDGTIYTTDQVQIGEGINTFESFPNNTRSDLLAFDGATGQQKFAIPLPSGHLSLQFIDEIGEQPRIGVDMTVGAGVGPLSMLSDESVQVVIQTTTTSQTNTRPFDANGFVPGLCPNVLQCETSASVHKAVQLLQVQTDGTFTLQPMTSFDFDNKNCFGNCGGPNGGAEWAGNFPLFDSGDVVPDGQGGTLAEWFDESFQTDGTNAVRGTNLVHFLASGGTSQLTLPLRPGGNFGDPSTSLVVEDENHAFANDGLNVVAFDPSGEAVKWVFAPGTDIFSTVAMDDGLLLFGRSREMVTLDASGNVVSDISPLNFASTTYSDSANLLAIATGGQIQMASFANAGVDPDAAWNIPEGFFFQRITSLPNFEQTASCSGFDRSVDTGNENWLSVGLQGTQTAPAQGTNNVVLASNMDFNAVDLISSDTSVATVSRGPLINRNHMTLTVTGLQANSTATITAADHQNHNIVFSTLHLFIAPRITRNVFPFAVSNLDNSGRTTLTPRRVVDSGLLQNRLELIYGVQANVHFTVNQPNAFAVHYDLNGDNAVQAN
jgi:Glucodextranase, domain B